MARLTHWKENPFAAQKGACHIFLLLLKIFRNNLYFKYNSRSYLLLMLFLFLHGFSQSESLSAGSPWLASQKRSESSSPITQNQNSCGGSQEMQYIPAYLPLGESEFMWGCSRNQETQLRSALCLCTQTVCRMMSWYRILIKLWHVHIHVALSGLLFTFSSLLLTDEVAGGSCILLVLLCIATVFLSIGGTALYCTFGDMESPVCTEFAANMDFYYTQILQRVEELKHWIAFS